MGRRKDRNKKIGENGKSFRKELGVGSLSSEGGGSSPTLKDEDKRRGGELGILVREGLAGNFPLEEKKSGLTLLDGVGGFTKRPDTISCTRGSFRSREGSRLKRMGGASGGE